MTVREALAFFAGSPKVLRRLHVLDEIGLGYLRLGQPATTLSGGEAQRIKIAAHLASRTGERLLYILDEPTTGLHFDDIAKLLAAFRKLLQAGHTLLVIEHNLDVIKTADYIIDLGPEGGEDGGWIVAAGTPEEIAAVEASHTGPYLRTVLPEAAEVAWSSVVGFSSMRQFIAAILAAALGRCLRGAQQLSFEETIARLRHPDVATRIQALALLEESGYPEAGPPIAALLTDLDDRIQRAAHVRRTRASSSGRASRSAGRWAESWKCATRAPPSGCSTAPGRGCRSRRCRTRSWSRCSARFATATSRSRLEAIYALGLLGQLDGRSPTPAYKDVAEALAERLGDPSPETRVAVARAAGRIFRRGVAIAEAPGVHAPRRRAGAHAERPGPPRAHGGAHERSATCAGSGACRRVADGYRYYQGKPDALPYLATLARIAHPTSPPLFKTALTHRDSLYRLVGGEGMARLGGEEALAASAALMADRVGVGQGGVGVRLRQGRAGGGHRPAGAGDRHRRNAAAGAGVPDRRRRRRRAHVGRRPLGRRPRSESR